eukprot:217637_1
MGTCFNHAVNTDTNIHGDNNEAKEKEFWRMQSKFRGESLSYSHDYKKTKQSYTNQIPIDIDLINGWIHVFGTNNTSHSVGYKDICDIIYNYYVPASYWMIWGDWNSWNVQCYGRSLQLENTFIKGINHQICSQSFLLGDKMFCTSNIFSTGIHYWKLMLIHDDSSLRKGYFDIIFAMTGHETSPISYDSKHVRLLLPRGTQSQIIGVKMNFDNGSFIVKHCLDDENDNTETQIDVDRNDNSLYRLGVKLNRRRHGAEILCYKNISECIRKMDRYPHPNSFIEYAECEWDIDKKYETYLNVINKFGNEYKYDRILQKCYLFCMNYCVKKRRLFENAFAHFMKINHRYYMRSQYLNSVAEITQHFVNINADISKLELLFRSLNDKLICKYKLWLYAAENIYQHDCFSVVKYYEMETDNDIKLVYYKKVIDKFGNDHSNDIFLMKCYIFCFEYFYEQCEYLQSVECYIKMRDNKYYEMRNNLNLRPYYQKYYGSVSKINDIDNIKIGKIV